MKGWSGLRGVVLFIAGLAGEVVLTVAWLRGQDPNQSLMLLFATMMGLPVFLQKDENVPPPPPTPPPPAAAPPERADRLGGDTDRGRAGSDA